MPQPGMPCRSGPPHEPDAGWHSCAAHAVRAARQLPSAGTDGPVQLARAPSDLVVNEETWGNIQVLIPFRSTMDLPACGRCPVELDGDTPPRIAGIEAPLPEGVAYRAITALVGAFPGGLSRQALNLAAKAGDARNALRDLVETYPVWRSALRFPREKGDYRQQSLGYRIAPYIDVISLMRDLAASGVMDKDAVNAAIEKSDAFRAAG